MIAPPTRKPRLPSGASANSRRRLIGSRGLTLWGALTGARPGGVGLAAGEAAQLATSLTVSKGPARAPTRAIGAGLRPP